MTYHELLQGVNAYPIPTQALVSICMARGLYIDNEVTSESINDDACRLARADVMMWLADAPNVSQGGQSYTFDDTQRARFRRDAQQVYDAIEGVQRKTIYGYKGSKL